LKISTFEIECYESEGLAYRWRDGLAGSPGGKIRCPLLRVKTDEGIDGLVWMNHEAISRDLIERSISPAFVGADPMMREKIWAEMWAEYWSHRSYPMGQLLS
jgi:hypothetical protein